MRRIFRVWAVVGVIVCLVAFFSATSGSNGGSSANGTRQTSWFSIGQPWPWYESRMEQEIRLDGGQSGSSEAGVILKTPAWLLPAFALAGCIAFRRLRQPTPVAAST